MTVNSDPLAVLLDVRDQLGVNVDDELIKICYQIQSDHQYDKDRDTMKKMKTKIEAILKYEDDVHI